MALLFRLRLVIFFMFLAALCYGLFRPAPPPDLFDDSDKYLHLVAFFCLGLSARFAFVRASGAWVWSALLASAPVLEYLQHYVQPHRTFSGLDALANAVGVLLALAGWWVIRSQMSGEG
ncbi:VanZ family protein [Oceanimonas marisflavi]|uniref:hypothetical protein n=1 Tax=Oceanimonas marisflavi TaxID=2059724 RepID=UPI000D3204F5|nr:hypothetical protein [Oceanimonas marisflavi]